MLSYLGVKYRLDLWTGTEGDLFQAGRLPCLCLSLRRRAFSVSGEGKL